MSDINIELVDDGGEGLIEPTDVMPSTTTTNVESAETSQDVKCNTTSQKTDSSSTSTSTGSDLGLDAFLKEKSDVSPSHEIKFEIDLSGRSAQGSNSIFANAGSVSSNDDGTTMTDPLVPDPELPEMPVCGIGGFAHVRRQIRAEERRLCLEANCLCGACINELIFMLGAPLAFFINTKQESCIDCGRQSLLKDYQTLCIGCSRCTNICMKCRDAPVVTNGEYCDFESLLEEEHDTTFKSLPEKTQITIIKEVYKAYDMYEKFDESMHFAKTVFKYLIAQFQPKSS